jgi:hypothetical protein
MSPSEPFARVPGAAASVAIRLAPESLPVAPREVNRYAGGSRYQPDSARRGLAREALATAGQLITPALVYAVHMAVNRSPAGALELHNGCSVSLPGKLPDSQAGCLAALVCTLGPGLEEAGRDLHRQGKILEALFLDAAGTALLEALGQRAYDLLGARARLHGLFPGCRFAPGYETMPLTEQALLFRLVDAAAIGVRLNRHLVMIPNKSLSFFVTLSDEKSSAQNVYKCRACSIKDCRYRLPKPEQTRTVP